MWQLLNFEELFSKVDKICYVKQLTEKTGEAFAQQWSVKYIGNDEDDNDVLKDTGIYRF